jgi:hypothetical protein
MASRRYFDAAYLVSGGLVIFHPYDVDRIRLLLSSVVAPDNKASDDIDLEYQLQRIMCSSR